MAKYQIMTPGGYEVEVSAKDEGEAIQKAKESWQSMPRIVAKQGDTRIFERSNGQRYLVSPGYSTTDQEKVNQALSGMTGGEVSRKSIDESLIEQYPIAARAGEFTRGAPFVGSYADELVGAIAGPEAATGMRALSGAMQRQRPGETLGLNLAGGLTGTAGMMAAAPQAAAAGLTNIVGQGSRAAQIARGATAGATAGALEGLVYGAGEGTTAEERMQEAGRGAAIGATGGAVFGGAAPIVSEVASNVIGLFRRSDIDKIAREFDISKNAARVIKNTFDQGGDIDAAVVNLRRAGSEGMLVDAGPAAQALLDATAASGGRAGTIVRGAVDERMSRTNQAVTGALDDALGTPAAGPRTAVEEIAAKTSGDRSRAYDLAYRTPINYASDQGRNIEDVLSRIEPSILKSAIDEANADMAARNVRNMQIMARIDDAGKVVYDEMPNVQQLDEIKKALQSIAYENVDNFGRLTGKGRRYNDLARQLRDATADAAEPYGAAVALGGDKISEERAFSFGESLLRPSTRVEDIGFELGKNPSQAQIESAKRGLRTYIEETLGNVRAIASDPTAESLEARQVIKAVTDMSSGNARKKIRDLMGTEADALLAQIDEAAQSASVRAAMAQNSKTAGRQAIQGTVDELTAPGAVGQAMQGEAVNTTKALIQAVTGQTSEYTAAQRQRIYEDIARALTQKRGKDAMVALRVLDQAMKGQSLTDAQTDTLSKLISSALFSGATTGVTRGAAAERRQSSQETQR